MQFNIFKQKSC